MKKILPVLLCRCLFILLFASLAACSSHTKQTALHKSNSSADGSSQVEDVSTVVEPEETAQEEMAALNRLGGWGKGETGQQGISSLPAGINLSEYDFPITINKQVVYYLELFQGKQRDYFAHWLARSTQYLPFIQEELKKAGLPQDLAYLAMIESGFNPSAYSPADASGLWQFIEGTGRTYGLKIDSWVDERREPEKATKAAIRYLAKLYSEFDDWYLAVAAYNTGEKRIENVVKNYNTKDFWELAGSDDLYLETKRYVPKLIAAILIARNPEKFGFTDIKYHKPQQYEVVEVPGGLDLEAVATACDTPVKHLRILNNELLKNQTPVKMKSYALRLPVGKREYVASNLDKLHPVTTTIYTTHTVKNGETLTTVCNLYNISKTTLLKANNLRSRELRKGTHIQIPTTVTKYVFLKKGEKPEEHIARNTNSRQTVIHQMKQGETLASLAKQYHLQVNTIMQWNKISDQRQAKKGKAITLYLDRVPPAVLQEPVSLAKGEKKSPNSDTEKIPSLEGSKKRSVVANNIHPVPVPQKAKQPTWYVVKTGDSLLNIAKKFQVSTQSLRQWNNLSNNNLQTGNKIIIKKEG